MGPRDAFAISHFFPRSNERCHSYQRISKLNQVFSVIKNFLSVEIMETAKIVEEQVITIAVRLRATFVALFISSSNFTLQSFCRLKLSIFEVS